MLRDSRRSLPPQLLGGGGNDDTCERVEQLWILRAEGVAIPQLKVLGDCRGRFAPSQCPATGASSGTEIGGCSRFYRGEKEFYGAEGLPPSRE